MMAQKVIFDEQTLTIPVTEEGLGEFEIAPALFVLAEGETYRVVWDGAEHECVCVPDDFIVFSGAPCVTDFVLDESGNPVSGSFALFYASPELSGAEGGATYMLIVSETEEHTLAIYQDAAETPSVILKDHGGNDLTYDGSLPIRLDMSDGTTKDYIPADSVPEAVEASVALDFSGGDMEVTPEKGKVFSKVAIPTPANLIPGNIAEGVDIAGIIGTLVAGGGGGNAVIRAGSFTGTGGIETVNHKLGVIPDIVVVFASKVVSSTTKFIGSIGYSSAMIAKGYSGWAGCDAMYSASITAGIETDAGNYVSIGYIRNATESTFQVGGASLSTDTKEYRWIAIGGLT